MPYALRPNNKTASDHLIDYMADIAGLLNDCSQPKPGCGGDATVEIEFRTHAVLNKLYSWRWSWEARNHRFVFEVNADKSSPFDSVLYYAHPLLMYEIWLCNALLIILFGLLKPFESPNPTVLGTHDLSGPLRKPGQESTAQAAAIEISRSFEYQLRNLSAQAPVHQWAMPLALAYVTLESSGPIAEWIMAQVHAAPPCRSRPWLLHVNRLQEGRKNASRTVFAEWPIDAHGN